MKVLKAAVVGRSLTHSISPEVHRLIFPIVRQKCDCEFDAIAYSKIELQDEKDFFDFIRKSSRQGFGGVNVTFPYKFSAASIESERSETVARIKSANTILCSDIPKIISTDGLGFLLSLQNFLPNLQPLDYSLTILGAGGAARAILDSIYDLGWKTITIAARSPKEAERTVSQYKNISVVSIENFSRDTSKQFIVQATPVGQRTSESLLTNFEWHEGDIAEDLVYNPLITRFLDTAQNAGATIIDGLGMLIEQAALSQYFWMTGKESDTSALTNAEFQELHNSLSKFVAPQWNGFAI